MSRRWKLRRDRKPEDAHWHHGLWPARSVDRFVVSFPKSGRRDTVVSYYFASTSRARRSALPERPSLGNFLRHASYGIERILLFNQACSASLRDDPGPALLLAYEDLHRDAMGSLRSVLDFLEAAPVRDGVLRSAVEYGRFENMQRLERDGSFKVHNRRLVARHPDDPESYKTGRGEVGGYRDCLSAEEIAYLEERIGALQPPELGYLEPGVRPRPFLREVRARA